MAIMAKKGAAMQGTKGLTLEQDLCVRRFSDSLEGMSPEQLKEAAIMLQVAMLQRENQYKALVKTQWGF